MHSTIACPFAALLIDAVPFTTTTLREDDERGALYSLLYEEGAVVGRPDLFYSCMLCIFETVCSCDWVIPGARAIEAF